MENFTLKALFPEMDNIDRSRLGDKVRIRFRTWSKGGDPEKIEEDHNGHPMRVNSYPIEINGRDFLGLVIEMAKEINK